MSETKNDANRPSAAASAPHERDASHSGLTAPDNVTQWRKSERARLIAERLAMPAESRAAYSQQIADRIEAALADVPGAIVSVYWPFRGEPDLRPLMETLWSQGRQAALPIVVAKGQPMQFRLWRQGEPLTHGVWNIPIPANGAEVTPDIIIAPIVGFDRQGFRLGYGGGFFDRTLAALDLRPTFIGVGYGNACLPTVFPQPHDIPMHTVITEAETISAPA